MVRACGLDSHVIGHGRSRPAKPNSKDRGRLTITPQYSLSAMPAVNVGVTNFEFPENTVRVLLTGYGVSLAVIFVALISSPPYR
jgi:hypothetical protein